MDKWSRFGFKSKKATGRHDEMNSGNFEVAVLHLHANNSAAQKQNCCAFVQLNCHA